MASKAPSNSELKRLARQREAVEVQRRAKLESVNAHRAEELYWKNRSEEPDWSTAFDVQALTVPHKQTNDVMHWTSRGGSSWQVRSFETSNGKIGYTFPERPGLVYLPGYLDIPQQRDLIKACLEEATGPASRTNLDTHYKPPPEGWWGAYTTEPDRVIETRQADVACAKREKPATIREQVDLPPVNKDNFLTEREEEKKSEPAPSESAKPTPVRDLIRKLRWTILGLEYHWTTKMYKWDRPAMPIPSLVMSHCAQVVQSIPWEQVLPTAACVDTADWSATYKVEAGVVNYYQSRDTLTAHVDQSEVDASRPLVSISVGESAIFLVGGATRDEPPIPILLRSGDVVIMSGPSRRVFHGVPRILQGSVDEGLLRGWDEQGIVAFVRGTRINVNVRQVFS